MTTDTAPRMNYIFVDYENVQDVDLDLIAGKAVKVFLVVGQRRKTLPALLASQASPATSRHTSGCRPCEGRFRERNLGPAKAYYL
jgi:hypothetical protein